MSLTVETAEQAEALVNTLHIEGAALTDANLAGLSTSDLAQLADLQAELEGIDNSDIGEIEVKQMLNDDIVDTEIGEQEVEIEAEDNVEDEPKSADETRPDSETVIKFDSTTSSSSGAVPPPLRPLTIAPKPTASKTPMALKTAAVVNSGSGQQIVLIQSPGGNTSAVNIGGQQIKLVSAAGQPITIPNLHNLQLANKAGNIVQLRTVSKSSIINQSKDSVVTSQVKNLQGNVKKNVLTKVLVAGNTQGQVVISSPNNDSIQQPQQIKLVSSLASGSIPTTAKTITLAQAQQIGLIPPGKLITQTPGKQAVLVNKQMQGKSIKLVPQVKSPTKILPAPVQGQKIQTKQGLQRVIIKQGGQLKAGTVVSGMNQVIRIPSGQNITPGQVHQINVPGKGVQFIRFMSATTTPSSSVTTNTVASTKVPTHTSSSSTTGGTQKAQVVPIGGISVNRTIGKPNLTVTTSSASHNVFKVLPVSSTQTRPVQPKLHTTGQRILYPASPPKAAQTITTIPASALSQIQNAILPSGNNVSQIVMVPAQYMQQLQSQSQTSTATPVPSPKVTVTPKAIPQKLTQKLSPTSTTTQAKDQSYAASDSQTPSPDSANRTLEPNGIRPRKPCNCTKSLCLKLYCDCFANGEFCYLCNCMNCYNNLDKEEDRQRAIRNCLERNPNAFRPKIGKGREAGENSVRKHTKGCNCKRSGCLKNYCECYEAKIACSSNCKCIGCRNIEDSMEKKNIRPLATPETQLQVVPTAKSKVVPVLQKDITSFRPLINTTIKLPSTFITSEVIEATNQCMIAQADDAERNMLSDEMATKMILEEFGRCLVQIIECSQNATANT